MTSTIAVEELRVGMYIQLDGGWLSHPFPLSAFRIAAADEIATLRRLGLARVRWVPEKSDPAPPAANPGLSAPGLPAPGLSTPGMPTPGMPAPGKTATAPAPTSAGLLAPAAEDAAARRKADWLAAQREAAQRCERQYAEAAKAWREASDSAAAQPQQAGRTTLALTQAMLDKMLAAEDVGIRLMAGAGDRAAAHALNVAVIGMLVGRAMGLPEAELLDLGVGALLHDVGKLDLPDRLRHFDESFSAAETKGYREHVARGVLQGRRMGLAPGALTVIAQHHEQADGSGFPTRLCGEQQSVAARIVAIVNRYDRLCNPATRALPLTPHEALAMLFAQSRSRFDPAVLNAFIRMMGVYPAGSLVQLSDERYAMVVGVNSSRPLKPRVLVHGTPTRTAAATRAPVTQLLDLESQPALGIRRSLPAAQLPAGVLAALDPRARVSYYFEPLASADAPQELAA